MFFIWGSNLIFYFIRINLNVKIVEYLVNCLYAAHHVHVVLPFVLIIVDQILLHFIVGFIDYGMFEVVNGSLKLFL